MRQKQNIDLQGMAFFISLTDYIDVIFISLTDKIDDPHDVQETDRSLIVLYVCTYGIKTFKAGSVHRLCKKYTSEFLFSFYFLFVSRNVYDTII